jgi:hypothetical protein
MPEQADQWDEWWETDEGSAEEARAFDKIMKHAEMTDAMRRCMHRKPALRKPNANHPATQIPNTEPQQRPEKLVCGGEGKAQGTGRVALSFTLRRVRLLDPCAKYGSCKALIDGLRYAGLIHNDREEDITLEVSQEKVRHFKEEETIIQITYP